MTNKLALILLRNFLLNTNELLLSSLLCDCSWLSSRFCWLQFIALQDRLRVVKERVKTYDKLYSRVWALFVAQNINLRLDMVDTASRICSNAIISSAETKFPLMFKHSIWDSLKASASLSISSMIIRLFEMSRSFTLCLPFVRIISTNLSAVCPDTFVSERCATFKEVLRLIPSATWKPPASPIGLLLSLNSFKLLDYTRRSHRDWPASPES